MTTRKVMVLGPLLAALAAAGLAASQIRAENSATEPGMPWPISTEEADWQKILGTVGASAAPSAAEAAESGTEAGMPWPVSQEEANWQSIFTPAPMEAAVATASATESAMPWPVSQEEANWQSIFTAAPMETAAAETTTPAADRNVTEPGMPWPVAYDTPAAPKPAPAVSCQDELRTAAKAGIILFQTASASLDGTSSSTLEKIARIAKACSGVKITVEGHTDSVGTPDSNKRLSQRRADAIATYLVNAGVSQSILNAIGYGPDKPVASNDTDDGRAKNRRIEFTVN